MKLAAVLRTAPILALIASLTNVAVAQEEQPAEAPSDDDSDEPGWFDKKNKPAEAPVETPEEPEEDAEEPASPPPKEPAEDAESEPELTEEEELDAQEDEEEAAAKPPAKGKGLITGVVRDETGETMVEALVKVSGTKVETVTDLDGRFRLELPPGQYTIRVLYELYESTRVEQITVREGKATRVDVELKPDDSAADEVLVEDELQKSSLEGAILERKRSASIGDGVSRTEVDRTPDRNAAEAAKRVVGVTIVDGRFVYVRGLGERYTNALLNGAPLPSPEPDRQTVALDLFPTKVLEGITIKKQFLPDMPGDFAGGSVLIQTRDFPRKPMFQVTLGTGFDTASTFRDRPAQRGSSTDFLGFDSGLRQVPAGLPRDRKLDSSTTDDRELQAWAQRMNSYMSPVYPTSMPNYGGAIVAGNQFSLKGEQKLGMIGALTYGRSFQRRAYHISNYAPSDAESDEPAVRKLDDVHGVRGTDTVRWGAFGNASLELSRDHRLSLSALHSQIGESSANDLEGQFESYGGALRSVHLEYVSRRLDFVQIRGQHTPAQFNGGETDWHASWAVAGRDQPDTRDIVYSRVGEEDGGPYYQFRPGPTSGVHFFSEQDEVSLSAGLDHSQPVSADKKTKIKVGGLVGSRKREFSARRYVFEPARNPSSTFNGFTRCMGREWVSACPDSLFANLNIGPDGMLLRESTLRFDEYDAGLDTYAAYAMLDTPFWDDFQLAGGARVEMTDQRFAAWDPHDREDTTIASQIHDTTILPALSVVYRATRNSNTRFGISKTLARPQLRESAPFYSQSAVGELPSQGNSDLKLTKILNADLRFETFPTLREVLAFSFFYKRFTDPIEEVIVPGANSGINTYTNAPAADLIGLELEARKNLGVFSPSLQDFSLIGNLTIADSRVDLGEQVGIATNPSRPMSYQSPYVVNVSLDYERSESGTSVRVLYRTQGARITTVGARGVPDIYEMPRHVVDVSAAQKIGQPFELKLTIQNLLNSDVVLAHQGSREFRSVEQDDGTFRDTLVKGEPETLSYDPGTIFEVQLSYTY